MAKRARILLLTDDERNHRHARRLIDAGALPIRNPWLLGPADLDSLSVQPDVVVALGAGAVLPAARLRERLGLPGPRPADVHALHAATSLPLDGALGQDDWLNADVCHVDGVVVGGRVVFAAASRHLGDFTTGTGTGALSLDDAEARPLLDAAASAVRRLSIQDGGFHVELFDLPAGPVVLSAAPHPPGALPQLLVWAATGVDLLAEHIRAGVGRPNVPRRTRHDQAGYWRVPHRRTPRSRPAQALPDLRSEVVLSRLPRPGHPAPAEVVVRAPHPVTVLTDLINLREHLAEQVRTT